MTTTTTTTTPANGPERFQRYCAVCMVGVREGFLCEDIGAVFCTVECAAVRLHSLCHWVACADG